MISMNCYFLLNEYRILGDFILNGQVIIIFKSFVKKTITTIKYIPNTKNIIINFENNKKFVRLNNH